MGGINESARRSGFDTEVIRMLHGKGMSLVHGRIWGRSEVILKMAVAVFSALLVPFHLTNNDLCWTGLYVDTICSFRGNYSWIYHGQLHWYGYCKLIGYTKVKRN